MIQREKWTIPKRNYSSVGPGVKDKIVRVDGGHRML